MMILNSKTNSSELRQVDRIGNNVWIDLVNPTKKELKEAVEKTGALMEHITAALDEDEKSRIEVETESTLFIFRIPFKTKDNKMDTLPLGIVATKKNIITICLHKSEIINDFYEDKIKNFFTNNRTRFILRIFSRANNYYLRYLNLIEKDIDVVEKTLMKAFSNKDIAELLAIRKTLIYFNTAVISNGSVLDKISKGRTLKLRSGDDDLLEDIIIDNKQVIEMSTISSNVLGTVMDEYVSIISNNLNNILKFLTSITIIVAIPPLISGFFGMNVGIPISENPYAFWIIVMLSIMSSASVAYIFVKKRWF